MISNISDVLTDSLILVGAYAQGQTANSDDLALALRVVNRKLDSLSAEKLSMVGMNRGQYALNGAASYTYGPGQFWNAVTRPVKIKSASVVAANGVEKEATLPTADQWASIPDKTRTGIYVEALFYDQGYPSGNIYVTPIPSGGNCILWTFQVIPQLLSTTGTVDMAPGYTEAIVNIAAVELCVAFQRPLTQELNDAAVQAKNVIAQLNAELFSAPMPAPEGPGPTSPPAVRTT